MTDVNENCTTDVSFVLSKAKFRAFPAAFIDGTEALDTSIWKFSDQFSDQCRFSTIQESVDFLQLNRQCCHGIN